MGLKISNATFGYDTNGMLSLIDEVKLTVIPDATKSIRNKKEKIRSTIDTVWVGSSADAFKDKLDYDTDVLCEALLEIKNLISENLNNVGSNVEDIDAEVAKMFGGSDVEGSSYQAGNYTDYSHVYEDAKNKVDKRNDTKENILNGVETVASGLANAVVRTSCTVVDASLGLVEGVGEFTEAIVDTGAIAVTGVASIFTGIYDFATGSNATEKMWDNTMSYVSKTQVKSAYDNFYSNTAVGSYLATNAYGYELTRGISSGVGYTAGVVALTLATFGTGGAAISAGSLATTAGVAGFGKGAETAWNDGAGLGDGLLYAGASGAWEATQFYVGAKISGFNALKSTGANIVTRVGMDTLDGAAEGLVQPLLQKTYKDESYAQLFNEAGGWGNVATQAAIGAAGSVIGEANNIAKATTGMTVKEIVHNAVSADKVVSGITVSPSNLLKQTEAANLGYTKETSFFDFLKKNNNTQSSSYNIDPNVMYSSATGRKLNPAETSLVKYINNQVNQTGSAVIALDHSYQLRSDVLANVNNLDNVRVQIKTGFNDLNGNYKPKYNAALYIDRITYTGTEAKTVLNQIENLQSRVNMNLPTEARAKQIYDIVTNEYSYLHEYKSLPDGHKIGASLRGITANNSFGKKGLVCAGYAQLYKELCDRSGIACEYVRGKGITSSGSGGHAWNVVITESGDQIPVDTCWGSGGGNGTWFGKSDAFASGHIADADEMFNTYSIDKTALDNVMTTMDNKYGMGTGLSALEEYVTSGDTSRITRDNNCRNYIGGLSRANVYEYLNAYKGTAQNAMQSHISVPSSTN